MDGEAGRSPGEGQRPVVWGRRWPLFPGMVLRTSSLALDFISGEQRLRLGPVSLYSCLSAGHRGRQSAREAFCMKAGKEARAGRLDPVVWLHFPHMDSLHAHDTAPSLFPVSGGAG